MSGERKEPSVRFREPPENETIGVNGRRRQPGSVLATSPMALGEGPPVANSPRVYSYPGLAKNSPGGDGSLPQGFSRKRSLRRKINTEKLLPFAAFLSVAIALYMYFRCGCAIEEQYAGKRAPDLRVPPTNTDFEDQAREGGSTEAMRRPEIGTDPHEAPDEEISKHLDEVMRSETEKVGLESMQREPSQNSENNGNELVQNSIEAAFQDGTDVTRSLFRGRTLYPASDVSAKDVLGSSYARRVIVSKKSKLIFCPIPSAASTNWIALMRKLEGFPDYLDIQKARSRTASGLRYVLTTGKKRTLNECS
uniref:Carbohydrate sulfotransferase n=1 Tax=Rhodosorus marinus TaxID=101924 RepID=A0A7S3A0Z2_9RHOD|mmetsp:Transcript_40600/g.161021  ORF Transcript_40600/g.161021 Transcript_40600/m.161021 type:complete len:308 (+) Transcript_40600:328-1251(+)